MIFKFTFYDNEYDIQYNGINQEGEIQLLVYFDYNWVEDTLAQKVEKSFLLKYEEAILSAEKLSEPDLK